MAKTNETILMTLSDLIAWAAQNGIDFSMHVEIKGRKGYEPLRADMLTKRGDDGLDVAATDD